LTLSVPPFAADQAALSAPANARLLVVDDVEENREILRRRLTRQGYDVSVANDGKSALDALEGGDFDLVLLDIMMPGMDGLETLERLRRKHERGTLPVIMVSARSDSADMVKALELGANDYITKPINFPVALARIATHLTLKRADDVLRSQLLHALEREQAATKLRESEEFARLIADNMPVIISYFDADKTNRFINQVAVEWHDRPREEIIGKPLPEDILGPDIHHQDLLMQRALAGEPQTFDKAATFPDGKFREVTISYIPHTNEVGNVVGFFGIVQDNTQRLEIERQLNQAQKMEAIGQLTGGIAHDFNNILMVTDGNVRLALKNIDDPTTVQDTLEEVLIGTDRAAKLTKQLLSFSRRQIMEKRSSGSRIRSRKSKICYRNRPMNATG
jgi:PAS domain S-box-containing protein